MTTAGTPLVGILMGSKSDWETMRHVSETLAKFDVPSESRGLSAHRTPKETSEYVTGAAGRGILLYLVPRSIRIDLDYTPSPAARRRPDKNSSRSSGLRYRVAGSMTAGVIARSRAMICRASSSRPICTKQEARMR